jgi:hypothetical protein
MKFANHAFAEYERKHPGVFDAPVSMQELQKLKIPKMSCERISDDLKAQIRADLAAGIRAPLVALRHGVSINTVRGYLRYPNPKDKTPRNTNEQPSR